MSRSIKINNKRFPKRELNRWLKGRTHWDHNDWENLLKHLCELGFANWTYSKISRDLIGDYLEKNRKR